MDAETSPPGSIQVEAVRKTCLKWDKPAPTGVDLRVDAGRVCALPGPNTPCSSPAAGHWR